MRTPRRDVSLRIHQPEKQATREGNTMGQANSRRRAAPEPYRHPISSDAALSLSVPAASGPTSGESWPSFAALRVRAF
jgi:hypothetical protein